MRGSDAGVVQEVLSAKICPGDFMLSLAPGSPRPVMLDLGSELQKGLLRCLIPRNGSIEVQSDAGGLFAVFADRDAGVVSSSLCAVLRAGHRRYAINTEALREQLVTGAISGRETLFHGIERLDGAGQYRIGTTQVTFTRLPSKTDGFPLTFRSRRACIDFQLEVLRSYFADLAATLGHKGASMGLSAGFDSRLMLALALDAGISLSPFTYESSSHNDEIVIAELVASHAGLALRRIPVRSLSALQPADLEANIEDAIQYFDGRTNRTMGTFNDVHTARVHRQCVSSAAINLNGLGGELYRNRERLPWYEFDFSNWFWQYVTGPTAYGFFVSDRSRQAFEKAMTRKYGDQLGEGPLKRMDRATARRWYREVWLPFFAGPRLSAENRVAPAVMPFADGTVSAAALAATPFIGPHGEFEATLIECINRRLARLPSSYHQGPDFLRRMRCARDAVAASVPVSIRLARHRLVQRPQRPRTGIESSWQDRFAGPLSLLKRLNLGLDIDLMLSFEEERARVLYVAEFLFRHRAFIDINQS